MRFKIVVLGILMTAVGAAAFAGDGGCFIKDGDRVGFFGDSITEAKVYGQITELVFRHFHPEAKVSFVNNGHSGLQLAGTTTDVVLKGDPNVVTLMIGMNDIIIGSWVRGMPVEPVVARYKAKLVTLVRELKERGKEVVIFTPTLTDETPAMSCFMTEGTRLPLAAMGKACEEVAREESVHCLPIQSEFERYEESLPRFALLRPDGVHPCARGHYQIARSIWTHLNLAGPLKGSRSIVADPQTLDVRLSPASNMIPVDSDSLEFSLSTPKPAPAKVTWSLGEGRGSESLNLTGTNAWTLKLPPGLLPQTNATSATLVIDIESQGTRQVFVVDVFRKMVIHGKDGEASGSLADTKGGPLCSYRFKKEGRGLVFEASVKKKELVHSTEDQYPWGMGDALTLYLDIRKGSALGGLGFDGDVYQVWFKPRDKPFFSPGFHPWSGKHMANVATPYGERSPEGYKVGLLLEGYVNLRERFDVSDRDFIGFDLSVVCAEAIGKQTWTSVQNADRQNFLFPGAFALLDLNGKWKGDSTFTASVFPGRP